MSGNMVFTYSGEPGSLMNSWAGKLLSLDDLNDAWKNSELISG